MLMLGPHCCFVTRIRAHLNSTHQQDLSPLLTLRIKCRGSITDDEATSLGGREQIASPYAHACRWVDTLLSYLRYMRGKLATSGRNLRSASQ